MIGGSVRAILNSCSHLRFGQAYLLCKGRINDGFIPTIVWVGIDHHLVEVQSLSRPDELLPLLVSIAGRSSS
jgi:hypothetical protein